MGVTLSPWSGTLPAEARPPLAGTETWELALRLRTLANELARDWPKHRENLHKSIETPFVDEYLPAEQDDMIAASLLWEVADALNGLGPWTRVRAAFDALRGEQRGTQERQAAAIAKCEWALKAWRRIDRRRRRRETLADHQARLAKLRPLENRIARTLIDALVDQDSRFRRLQIQGVRTQLAGQKRGNASPIALLIHLDAQARVWNASTDALKKSKKRQTGT